MPFSADQLWEYNVVRAALGCLSAQEFAGLANALRAQRLEATNMKSEHVRLSRSFAYLLRHNGNLSNAMDHQNSVSVRTISDYKRRLQEERQPLSVASTPFRRLPALEQQWQVQVDCEAQPRFLPLC